MRVMEAVYQYDVAGRGANWRRGRLEAKGFGAEGGEAVGRRERRIRCFGRGACFTLTCLTISCVAAVLVFFYWVCVGGWSCACAARECVRGLGVFSVKVSEREVPVCIYIQAGKAV